MPGSTRPPRRALADAEEEQRPRRAHEGPTVIGMRGPIRADSAAARDDSSSRASVIGSPDNPACSALQPTAWSWST